MISIGIDPGLSGAIAAIQDDVVLLLENTPVLPAGKGSSKIYDEAGMLTVLNQAIYHQSRHGPTPLPVVVMIEIQQAMPKQGATSAVKTGFGWGLWVGMCCGLRVRYECVRGAKWKPAIVGGAKGQGDTKTSARLIAQRLFPDAELGKRKTEDRSDALLLAEYGRRIYGQ